VDTEGTPKLLRIRSGGLTQDCAGTDGPLATEDYPMTTSLPPTLDFRRREAVKRAAQRVIHVEEIALGFAAVGVWSYAFIALLSG
jgi:hypothetical protein